MGTIHATGQAAHRIRRHCALLCAALLVVAGCSGGRSTSNPTTASAPTHTPTPPAPTAASPDSTSPDSTSPDPTSPDSTSPGTTATHPTPGLRPDLSAVAAAAATAAGMSDEAAVGQLLMPVAYGADANQVTPSQASANQNAAGVDTPAQMVAAYHLGGVILMGQPGTQTGEGAGNVSSPEQITALTADLQTAAQAAGATTPILVATDQEGGVVTRMPAPATRFPGNLALGAAPDPTLATQAASATGRELRATGVNVDLAPVADVTSGPGNAVIGSRSFGSDPAQVAALTAAAVSGYQSAGVAAAVKHFPGHGSTDVDSHVGTPHLTKSLPRLSAEDLAPFAAAVQSGVALVMTGHLVVDAIDPDRPASLSALVVDQLLRTQLGFTGVIATDALRMPPVAGRYDSGEAAVQAVLAGNDLLVLPANLKGAYDGLLAAVKDGTLPRTRVNESVARLLALRDQLAAQPTPAASVVGSAEHLAVAAHVAREAVTLAAGSCSGPLIPVGPVRVTGADAATRTAMGAALRDAGFTTSAAAATTIALTGYGGPAVTGDVTVALDTPYVLGGSQAPVKIAAYRATPASLQAVAQLLAGQIPPAGRLPVAVDGLPPTACP